MKRVNFKERDFDVYIGRPSKWGNPFPIRADRSREEAIRMFEKWIRLKPKLLGDLPELQGKTLGCFCKEGLACHGDVLIRLVEEFCEPGDWTAYYGPCRPDDAHKSGFGCCAEAMSYSQTRKDLDTDAWLFLKTEYYERCEDWEDVHTAAGYYPSELEGGIDLKRFPAYLERCHRLGMADEDIGDLEEWTQNSPF